MLTRVLSVCLFVSSASIRCLQSQPDVIEAAEQTVSPEGVDLELGAEAHGVVNLLRLKVDGDPVVGEFLRAPDERLDVTPGELHGEQAVLEAVVPEDVAEAGGYDDLEPVLLDGPRSVLAGRADPELGSAHEDAAARVLRLVEDEILFGGAVRVVADVDEQQFAEANAVDLLHEPRGDDLVGVYVGNVVGDDFACVLLECFHHFLLSSKAGTGPHGPVTSWCKGTPPV